MAQHIDGICTSPIPKVSKDDFYAQCKPGMTIFCQGSYAISKGIEAFSGGPFSHMATLIYLREVDRWGVLEATEKHGVHIGHLDYYVESYQGNLVLAAVPALSATDLTKLLQAQFDLVDDAYDTQQEVLMAAHKLLKAIPIVPGKHAFFCSGLYEQGRRATSVPLQFRGPGMANPEQVWCDPSIVPICALVKI